MLNEEKIEARRKIIEDVIKHLNSFSHNGGYISFNYNRNPKFGESLQEYFPAINHNCDVCALGAMFIGYVDVYNNYNFNITISRDTIIDRLSKYFDRSELDEIEAAYEGYCYDNGGDEYSCSMINKYPDNKERMRIIMENMLRNNTIFDINQEISFNEICCDCEDDDFYDDDDDFDDDDDDFEDDNDE